MDIGSKIKKARINANLTQEQAAEALGVSRQTISNWENAKTYPDIVSVVKMSDLYRTTLDHLLKEETTTSGYLNYLEESTNTVKSNDRKIQNTFIAVYLTLWSLAIMIFWFFTSASDALGYSLMFLLIVLPVSTFIFSLMIGKNNFWGKQKWISAVILGIMYMLAEYATFSTANMTAFRKFNPPQFGMLIGGTMISAIGIVIGCIIRNNNTKHRT